MFNVVLIKGEVKETPKSKKVYVEVQISETTVLHITEYGGYITAVNVYDLKSKKVTYKSVKYSIQDALNHLKVKQAEAEQIKLQIIVLRKQVKAQHKESNTVKDYKSLTYSDNSTDVMFE